MAAVPAPDTYTLLADVLLDGTGAEPILAPAVRIEGGVVVRTDRQTAAEPQGPIVDYRGCSIAPGLIDPHVHLALRPDLSTDDESIAWVGRAGEDEIVDLMQSQARAAFSRGVTTVRDCGSPGQTAALLRSRDGDDMPRLFLSGRPVTTARGHCHWMGRVAESAAELREAVVDLADGGADFIKVMVTGGMMTSSSDPYQPQYSAVALAGLVTAAHERGKRVAGHVLSAAGVRVALEAGLDTIEHYTTITSARQDFDPALTPALAAAGVIVGVTTHHSLREMLRTGDIGAIEARLAPQRALRDAGVRTAVHSDAGTPDTRLEDFAESVEIFMYGMGTTISQAVRAATVDAAAAIGIESEVGAVAPGQRADLVVLDGRLDEDVRALRRPVAVMKDGREHKPS
jgi:imidazolonepropionase-like amidohydrolase